MRSLNEAAPANEEKHPIPQIDLLRFLTCGSVDDGKSTLIGRLLLETGAVYEDQLAALAQDSIRLGTAGKAIDPALLMDGLEDERQQGITIDVAYRYFQTDRRKFISADSPGHEQYTRNMATAASTSQLAIILVDARKGLLSQTRRHSYIASLLGIRHLVLAVNKMDLVDYSQTIFEQICTEYREFVRQLNAPAVRCLPISGLQGDNVTTLSDRMPWFQEQPLLELLEMVEVDSDASHSAFRFPVQRVSRPHAEFRGYCGTVAAGSITIGDPVLVLPGGQTSRVQSIVSFDGDLPSVSAGAAVALTLEDEIDIARGDMLVDPEQPAHFAKEFEANIVWMSPQPLIPQKSYWLKHSTRRTTGEVHSLIYRTDVNTLNRVEVPSLALNETGRCRMRTHAPLAFDPYTVNRQTGSFILVDRVTHETIAAGMIVEPETNQESSSQWGIELQSPKLQFTPSRITSGQRVARFGRPACTLLLTGLSGSGKTTIAFALEERLFALGTAVTVLDGQNLRHGISRELGFSAAERSENLRRAAEIAALFNNSGIVCIAALAAPDESTRKQAQKVIGKERVLHVHLDAPLEVCRQRDLSGRYLAADRGDIRDFPGVTANYESPTDADLVLPTHEWSVEQCVAAIEKRLVSYWNNAGQGTNGTE
ncbi:sulfate adenylyltransferase subunit CysN [Lignipirellula cremea]|uniref:sulfate adenylyltransferase subunit CysN n=1 Tax=Lignipirellula cremea TaxID=2528010 RepID=UPI0028F4450E|nr:sulfate adenylyltransferase subunit CysN [Lignipirellula cremea]